MMIVRVVLAGLLLAHALIHVGFVSPRPATDGGPAWPFDLARSWILTPLGVDPGVLRILGIALVAVTLATFAASSLFLLGIVPGLGWASMAMAGAIASLALLLLFFHPWLVIGILVDLAIVWALAIADWDTASLTT